MGGRVGQRKGGGSLPPADRNTREWPVGGGEMGRMVREKDWAATPLGPIGSWSPTLRTTIGLCLASNLPISLAWGPGHVQIYNDGYWPICGEKHPHSMGQGFRECWASAWPVIGDAFEGALQGETSFLENQRMFLDRNGYLEETFFTFSFSPIRDETGGIGGLFHPVTDVTSRMLDERRTRALLELAARTANAQSAEGALGLAAKSLAECDRDLPFSLYYLLDRGRREARLIASTGLSPGTRASPSLLDLDASDGTDWPVARVARSGQAEQIDDLVARFGPIACGPYLESPKSAFVLPIHPAGGKGPIAIWIAGVSPRLPMKEPYRAFCALVANGITLAVARATAHEAERQHGEARAEIDRVAFVVDISERKRNALAFEKSQAQLAALYASGVIGIVASDETGRVTEANDAFLGTVGYSRDDLAAGFLNWVAMTPSQWRKQRDTALAQVNARGVADPWKQEFVRKDGCRVPVLVGIAATDEKNTIGFVADLTERRLAEEAHSRLEEEAQVETAGRERAELALGQMEEQLRQAQKMEAVGRLAGGVAHDFNNILSVVLTNSEMLLDDIGPESPLRVQVEEIRLAGKRAADLTRQLLMFSRKQVLEPKVFDLNRLLSGMDKMLRRLVGEDVDLISTPAATLAKVLVDRSSIEQVIMNLVVNARDAMPTGGQLAIETASVILDETYARHLEVTPGPHVVLAVSDTGLGMDRATQARIFEPFFTTKPLGQGTGLGLSTAFGIVEQSGGSIEVDSEPGKGTTFKVYLPLIEAAVDDERPSTLPPLMLTGSETILLVEDEDQVRSAARGILRRQHYPVIDAKNGNEALLLCEQHAGIIDLLLTDVVMPQMSGVELARRIAIKRPAIKVLFMSGYTDEAVIRYGALGAGIAFVQKPFTTETLARKVRQVLDKNPAGGG